MKMFDAAQITDMMGILILLSLLAAIAMAVIRFFRSYGKPAGQHSIKLAPVLPYFSYPYARKRVVNRIVHDCKHTVFPGNPDSVQGYPGNEGQCIGIQRNSARSAKRHTVTYIKYKVFLSFCYYKRMQNHG